MCHFEFPPPFLGRLHDRRRGKRKQQLLGVLVKEFTHILISLHDVDCCDSSSIVTVQTYQQHRLVVMHPNKAKTFPAATVLREQSWYTAAAENVGPEARRV